MGAIKVTLTLPEDVIVALDRFVAARTGATRSAACAEAIRGWLQRQQEAEIERYYSTMSDEERAEHSAWAALATESAGRTWP